MTTATQAPETFRLTPEQTRQFHRDGYLSPLTACSPEEMAVYRTHIERLRDARGGSEKHKSHNLHLEDRTVWEMISRPAIVGAMQSVLGQDLYVWRAHLFVKEPGGLEIPWHQDRNYWPIEPEIVVSAWLAVDQTTVENSALQVVPGSHRKLIRHVPATSDQAFGERADMDGIDMSAVKDLELKPGQFILFNERTLHHSEPNRSQKRRMGCSIRVTIPQVRVLEYDAPNHKLIPLSGTDRLGFNRIGTPPTEDAV